MGLRDRIKQSGRGVVTAAEPEAGTEVQSADELRRRLLAITGKGVHADEDGTGITVSWSAKVKAASLVGASYQHVVRAIEMTLDESKHEAVGRTKSSTTKAGGGIGLPSGLSKQWTSGPQMGAETFHVVAWLGPHETEEGADESGFSFSWHELREPVIEAVTGAGWTYRPH